MVPESGAAHLIHLPPLPLSPDFSFMPSKEEAGGGNPGPTISDGAN